MPAPARRRRFDPERLSFGAASAALNLLADPNYEPNQRAYHRAKLWGFRDDFRPFELWAIRTLGRDADRIAIEELKIRLAQRLKKPLRELDYSIPLAKAVRLVSQPEAVESAPPPDRNASGEIKPEAPAELPDLVTLNQAALAVHQTKRALEHYKKKGMPYPLVEGSGGRTAKWDWKVLRPWLEETFGIILPDAYPGNRNH